VKAKFRRLEPRENIMWIVHALPITIVLALFLSMVSDGVSKSRNDAVDMLK